MDMKPLSPEDIEYIKSTIPWMKVLGSGYLLSFVIALWKIFGLYSRLETLETDIKSLKSAGFLIEKEYLAITQSYQRDISALVDKQVTTLHIKWLEEMQDIRGEISDIKSTTSNISGKLDQLITGNK